LLRGTELEMMAAKGCCRHDSLSAVSSALATGFFAPTAIQADASFLILAVTVLPIENSDVSLDRELPNDQKDDGAHCFVLNPKPDVPSD
jgi:hypothetical protein